MEVYGLEERKAIKGLEWSQQQMRLGNLPDYDQGHYADIRIVLNLIEKQSKEIEELKDKYSDEKIRNTVIKRYREVIEKDYISKDKIKAKIGERMQKNNNIIHNAKLKYGKDYYWYDDVQEAKNENCICKEILQSLLEKE